ncbi:glycosyltransferase [Gammaproteobacteria bacterium LSUCC0112]|nr:glycosyltransferase [Gammaproteobacteria bacterium LSUCC0112]
MKLTYITRVRLPSAAAQSVQILAMSKAFTHVLGINFKLISNYGETSKLDLLDRNSLNWSPIRTNSPDFIKSVKFAYITFKECLRERDVVIFTRDIAVAIASVIARRKVLYEAHSEPRSRVSSVLFSIVAKSKYFRLVCISRILADYYTKNFGLMDSNVLSVHDGVFFDDYLSVFEIGKSLLRKSLGLPNDKIVIVHTGNPSKGRLELLENILALDKENILAVHVGGSKDSFSAIEQYFKSKGIYNIELREHVSVDEVRKYQVAADVLFYAVSKDWSSYWCTSPLKIFEYMAAGSPILAAKYDSISEVLNIHNSFCFDPDSIDSFLEAWKELVPYLSKSNPRAEVAQFEAKFKYSWNKRAGIIVDFMS